MGDINWAEISERYFFNSQLKIFQIATDFWEFHNSFCDCSHDSYYDHYCDRYCEEADSVLSIACQVIRTGATVPVQN